MEPVLVAVAVVALLLRFALRRSMRRHAVQAGSAVRQRLTGSSGPSTTGTYVMAALFTAFGLYLLLVDPSGASRTGIPRWIPGAVLVVLSVVLAVTARRRR